MGWGQRLSQILERKITIDFDAQINLKRTLLLTLIFSFFLLALGYGIGKKLFWSDSRGVFDRKVESLARAGGADDLELKSEMAFAYYLKGNAGQAQKLYEQILSQDNANAAANIYYGLILADQKKYPDAIPHLETGIKQEPGREKLAYLYLGLSYYNLGDLDKALSFLDISAKVDPGSSQTHYYLGLAYKKKGYYKEAEAALNNSLKLSGGNYPEAAKELQGLPK